ncbi:MAG: ANTAR domain-containing protein [Bacillota bacterium]|nr:ANTAR domain-containing protein [Bacillota bacterium]
MEQLRVLIAVASADSRKSLKQLLMRGGYHVLAETDDGFQALRQARSLDPDLVLADADLPGINGLELGRVLSEDRIAPILLISRETFPFTQFEREKGRFMFPVGYVTRPLTEYNLFPAIESILSFSRHVRDLESEIKSLREKIETRKIVERAKGILMEQLGISEAEAYRKLQKQSMDRCLPMRKVAEAIILAQELKQ